MPNKTLLAFLDDVYEDLELWYPKLRLEESGYALKCAAPFTWQRCRRAGAITCSSRFMTG